MKDQVVQMATHDLRNPLTVIHMQVSMLQTLIGNDEQARHGLEQIGQQADTMLGIITSMLDLARLETGLGAETEETDANLFFAQFLERYAAQTDQKSISLVLHPLETDSRLQLNRVQIARVTDNLIVNAIIN